MKTYRSINGILAIMILLILLLQDLSISSGEVNNTIWPDFQGTSSHTGFYDSEGPEGNGTSVVKTLDIIKSAGGVYMPPVIDDKHIYVSFTSFVTDGTDHIVCYDKNTLKVVWDYPLTGKTMTWGNVISGTTLIISTSKWHVFGKPTDTMEGTLLGIDINTGEKKWEFVEKGNTMGIPTVYDGKVYVTTGGYYYRRGGTFALCVDAETGKLVWKSDISEREVYPPSADDGVVIFPLKNGDIMAFSSSETVNKNIGTPKGKILWDYTVSSLSNKLLSYVTISHGKAYFTANTNSGGYLYSLDLKTGKEIWSSRIDGYVKEGNTVSNGTVYTMGMKEQNAKISSLYAIDANTGKKIWSATSDKALGGRPLSATNGVYITGQNVSSGKNFMFRYSFEGNMIWKRTLNASTRNTGSFSDNKLYLIAFAGGWIEIFDGTWNGTKNSTDTVKQNFMTANSEYYLLLVILIAVVVAVIILVKKGKLDVARLIKLRKRIKNAKLSKKLRIRKK